MTLDVSGILERARVAAQQAPAGAAPNGDREKLTRLAAEFESMMLLQVLKDMRKAGSWEEEGGQQDTLGAESLFETLDAELASHLARVKGMGLGRQLEEAFDRMNPTAGASTPNAQLPTPTTNASTPKLEVGSWKLGVDQAKPSEGTDVVSIVKAAPGAVTQLLKPVAGAVTSAFGWRRHPITHEVKFHQGVDLRAAYGQEVQAAAAGRVVFSGDQGGYGATVMIEHADGTRTRYAHLSARLVKKGDEIAAGAPLGRAGKSGHATGTHLHFEVIAADGRRIQPDQWQGRNPGQSDGLSAELKVQGVGAD